MSKTKKIVCTLLFVPLVFMVAFQAYVARDIEKNVVNPIKKVKQKSWNLDQTILQLEMVKAYLEREGLKHVGLLHLRVKYSLWHYKELQKEYAALKKCRKDCWDAKKIVHLKHNVASLRLEARLYKEVEPMAWSDEMRLKYSPYGPFLFMGYLFSVALAFISLVVIIGTSCEISKKSRDKEGTRRDEMLRQQGRDQGKDSAKAAEANVSGDLLVLTCADGTTTSLHKTGDDHYASREVLLKEAEKELQEQLKEKEKELQAKETDEDEEPTT